ncbi:GNAT family N-acetyltransferase [bacterium]|nr:GNAT family N-acetyltransferase [bacterium]
MSVRNLDSIFRPKRIVVIGASNDRSSVGYSVLRNLISAGYEGTVYPVNLKYESIQGIHAYQSLDELPHVPDLAIVCTPADTVADLLRQCGEAGVGGMIILSAGFREIGSEGRALEEQLAKTAREYPSLRIIGPNCLGVIAPHLQLNASFAATMPAAGSIAFLSQSGAVCTAVLDWASDENIGFSRFVSVGNMIDVTIADLIDYLGEDPYTRSAILYIESITGARDFMSAARAFTRTKPIVAYKAGRFAESAKAAASHTGAMAGEDAVYDAAFQRAGIVRAFELGDVFDCAELLARHQPPRGPRLAILTNAGGPGVIATDELIARHGEIARLSDETLAALGEILPQCWSHGNPVDILGDATSDRFVSAIRLILADDQVDAVLVIVSPQAMTDPTDIAKALSEVVRKASKPVIAAWMGGATVREGIRCLNSAGVPTYSNPEQGVRAFMHLVEYGRNLDMLYETPRAIPVEFTLDRERSKDVFGELLLEGHEIMSESMSKVLLDAYQIPVTRARAARSADEAVEVARRINGPVVLKILSPEITHKTDVGGVVLNLRTPEDVRAAFERITQSAAQARPDARIDGVNVQRMIDSDHGIELIIGAKKDATFGSVILVGTGGIAAECFNDRALGLPPLSERLARRMVESLRSWPLLRGYRGRPAVNLDRLIEVLMRFSYLVADYPEIREFDINPLLATPDDVIALDARAVIDQNLVGQSVRPYSHLAIRPYPEQYIREEHLSDGRPVTLRPIRPEDEPEWHELLAACSPESIHSRFRHSIGKTTHSMATRFCFIDYDREMAIVAEVGEGDDRKIAGVGRLVADVNHDTAEYAVLVGDPWQGQGLGGLLTHDCLEIARTWGIREVFGETDWDNKRMLATFRGSGFEMANIGDGIVRATLKLVGQR